MQNNIEDITIIIDLKNDKSVQVGQCYQYDNVSYTVSFIDKIEIIDDHTIAVTVEAKVTEPPFRLVK